MMLALEFVLKPKMPHYIKMSWTPHWIFSAHSLTAQQKIFGICVKPWHLVWNFKQSYVSLNNAYMLDVQL